MVPKQDPKLLALMIPNYGITTQQLKMIFKYSFIGIFKVNFKFAVFSKLSVCFVVVLENKYSLFVSRKICTFCFVSFANGKFYKEN